MKEEFPDWFGSQICQHHVDNDKHPEVSTTSELFALACGPTWTSIAINSCVVDGVRYVVHSRDEHRITQNSGIYSPGPDGEMYYEMSAYVARSHDGDGGGEDRPPQHHVPSGCMGCFANRGEGKRKPNLGGRAAGRLNTRDKTRNLSLKEITDTKGPVPIQFELR
nr:S-adenosyl-L-methionine-dependent methyltransferases superfamily protein [Tanacetum cinerariifolium]